MKERSDQAMAEDTQGARVALTRDRIVLAAIELIERDGADALSMRRVAAELGVAVMSLYNHVDAKAALLDAIAEHILSGMIVATGPEMHWTERARVLIRAFRKVARDYPRCVTVVLTRKVDAPSAMLPVEHALAVADDAGFDGPTSVRIMRALMAYAIGAQMREVGAAKMLDYLPEGEGDRFGFVEPERFQHVLALRRELFAHDPETDFEFGLDLLINALDALPRR